MTSTSENTNNHLIRIDKPIYQYRSIILKQEQQYAITHTALIKSWKIVTPNVMAEMYINGISVKLSEDEQYHFDLSKIREDLRELLPCTPTENKLCLIESSLYGTQLLAVPHYRYFPVKFLWDFIFTGELHITFKFYSTNQEQIPVRIDIIEEYVLSETQLIQRINRGETLANIIADKSTIVGITSN